MRQPSRPEGRPEVPVLRGHKGAVYAVAFTPDGLKVVSASRDANTPLAESAEQLEICGARQATLSTNKNIFVHFFFGPFRLVY